MWCVNDMSLLIRIYFKSYLNEIITKSQKIKKKEIALEDRESLFRFVSRIFAYLIFKTLYRERFQTDGKYLLIKLFYKNMIGLTFFLIREIYIHHRFTCLVVE